MEKSFRRLANKTARREYVRAELVNGVAHQIRILRHQRNWTQSHLARRLKTTQTVVSRLEDPSYGKFSVKTLLDVANAFDVAVHVRYMPFSEFMLQTWDTSPHRFEAVSYDEERNKVVFYSAAPSSGYLGAMNLPSSGQQHVASLHATKLPTTAAIAVSQNVASVTTQIRFPLPTPKVETP
jgi:transcriptional regulator with XRE-family HTH domain